MGNLWGSLTTHAHAPPPLTGAPLHFSFDDCSRCSHDGGRCSHDDGYVAEVATAEVGRSMQAVRRKRSSVAFLFPCLCRRTTQGPETGKNGRETGVRREGHDGWGCTCRYGLKIGKTHSNSDRVTPFRKTRCGHSECLVRALSAIYLTRQKGKILVLCQVPFAHFVTQ